MGEKQERDTEREAGMGETLFSLEPSTLLARFHEPSAHLSLAYFCPECGSIWARVRRAHPWFTLPRPCPLHPSPTRIGGSFFQDWSFDTPVLDLLASHPALLRHEFSVHLSWAETYLSEPHHAQRHESRTCV